MEMFYYYYYLKFFSFLCFGQQFNVAGNRSGVCGQLHASEHSLTLAR